jgi:hypothetical protein
MSPTEQSSKPADPGKWIRLMIIGLPVGTVILGIASFAIYFDNKERKEQRIYRHALALRRDVNEADLQRRLDVITQASQQSAEDRRLALAGFTESSLSPENMGYDVKTLNWKHQGKEHTAITAAVLGSRRPSDIVLVVTGFAGEAKDDPALSLLLAVAHSMTGVPRTKTLQFVVMDASPGSDEAGWTELSAQIRSSKSRVTQLVILGDSCRAAAEKWATQSGISVVTHQPIPSTQVSALMTEAQTLITTLTAAADRL